MRYVILRDDDTNALTPVDCLERLYRPFLDRNLPVNLAVIPDVATNALTPEGKPEAFLFAENGTRAATVPINENPNLVKYLRENPGYKIVQHGCRHECFEFELESSLEISARLERGTQLLTEAGFPRPVTFVAPHDKISRASYREVAKRFRVISSGWFELRRLPLTWWPKYLAKKTRHAAHWRAGGTVLLSHPGCLLSARRNFDSMLHEIIRSIHSRQTTVLVTHWWEYFSEGRPNETFIKRLHETADYLASQPDIQVISFTDVAEGRAQLN
ncbi:MAG TPA: DUF2334 domain-containing protein [Verrucomicrobiae bacterium]|jgi:hypothetical protein|nr:DUF2334 domain-containing protein [Verrucomicrobiae bacterium]